MMGSQDCCRVQETKAGALTPTSCRAGTQLGEDENKAPDEVSALQRSVLEVMEVRHHERGNAGAWSSVAMAMARWRHSTQDRGFRQSQADPSHKRGVENTNARRLAERGKEQSERVQ